ncbi:MAG: ketol-acid reductoisomerase [Candidatus Eisenbacteria bacterium]
MTRKRIFSEDDLDTSILLGKQIGIVGYGSQGRAQALNLRDSGNPPLIGIRKGRSFDKAAADGFDPQPVAGVARKSDIVMVLTPDESHPEVCRDQVLPNLGRDSFIGFAAGFTVHFGLVAIPEGRTAFLVAPKGPGGILRIRYKAGGGIPALVASTGDDPSGMAIAMAYAKAIGCARAGVIRSSFKEEAVADLLGEQCVLTGGLIELMKASFDVLVERGYSPEVAYIECISEVEYMASLISRVGLAGLEEQISSTAHFGGVTRGSRLIDSDVKTRIREIMDEIESGTFLDEFRAYIESGKRVGPGRDAFKVMEDARANLDEVSRRER